MDFKAGDWVYINPYKSDSEWDYTTRDERIGLILNIKDGYADINVPIKSRESLPINLTRAPLVQLCHRSLKEEI